MNVLLTEDWRAKLGDFGRATISAMTSTETPPKNGSIQWMAPELFQRTARKSKASDVYSFGITLWEISSRKIPFYDVSDEMRVIYFIVNGEKERIPDDCPIPFSQVIQHCWNSNQGDRPPMSTIVAALERNIDLLSRKEKSPNTSNTPNMLLESSHVDLQLAKRSRLFEATTPTQRKKLE